MKQTITNRSRSILGAGGFVLALAIVLTPNGRREVVSALAEVVRVGETVTELPCRIVTNLKNFSLDRLDPTCPQCI